MQNDTKIFWDLIEEHRASLWRYALALTRSRDESKDLLSETVLSAYASFPKLRDLGGFRKSLYTIASRIHTVPMRPSAWWLSIPSWRIPMGSRISRDAPVER